MGKVYHGSKEHGITRLEPRKSTHGTYVYATPERILAIHFSGRAGDDLVYDIGHFDESETGPWEIVENVPGALEKMYDNSSSIYTFDDSTFKDIHTGFNEVVSIVGVDVQSEEYIENVYDAIMELEQQGLVKIYRYPNKPKKFGKQGESILNKWRFYREKMNTHFDKNKFDRLVYLHPELLNEINSLIIEFGLDFQYQKEDLIALFKERCQRQLKNPDNEQFVDCAFISITTTFPELTNEINEIYQEYNSSLDKNKTASLT